MRERSLKRLLMPVTGPTSRRLLIEARDRAVGRAASWRAGRDDRMCPSFVIVGAQKAGTTFLHHELLNHPDVVAPITKEIHFFDDRFARGIDWYLGHFAADGVDGRQTGEASPGYLFHPHAPARLATALPDARVIVLLRDPVRRAYSHFLHERRLGYEPESSFGQALELEAARTAVEAERVRCDPHHVSHSLRHFSYRARGEYLGQLTRWEDAVGADKILVHRSEDLFTNPRAVLDDVQRFVGLRPWQPDRLGRNDMSAPAPAIDPGVARELAAHFAPHNAALAAHLGQELPWQDAA